MKRIHEGCLAMYVSDKVYSPNTGKIVRVGKPLGQIKDFVGDHFFWEVDKSILFIRRCDKKHLFFKFAPEQHLVPIDDDNKADQKNTHELLETTI